MENGVQDSNQTRFQDTERWLWQWPQCHDETCSNHINTEQKIQIACK